MPRSHVAAVHGAGLPLSNSKAPTHKLLPVYRSIALEKACRAAPLSSHEHLTPESRHLSCLSPLELLVAT